MAKRREFLSKSGLLLAGVTTMQMSRVSDASTHSAPWLQAADPIDQVHPDQRINASELKPQYDFIVCGSGSSGSVVARRLAENPDISVLMLEAGGSDDVPSVMDPALWHSNIGSERDWGFVAQPNPNLNGRSMSLSMGKVLGGGSSINGLMWSRGHKNDWDFFASEARDPGWSYESVLKIYRRIEDWHGTPDPKYRGIGGPMFVEPSPNSNPNVAVMVEGARSAGIPVFENPNGRMMEGMGGASMLDVIIHDGRRQSVFRSYAFPYEGRPNLTVLTGAFINRLTFDGKRATGVEIIYDNKVHHVAAGHEVVLSLGAINTPKVMMQSGIGAQACPGSEQAAWRRYTDTGAGSRHGYDQDGATLDLCPR